MNIWRYSRGWNIQWATLGKHTYSWRWTLHDRFWSRRWLALDKRRHRPNRGRSVAGSTRSSLLSHWHAPSAMVLGGARDCSHLAAIAPTRLKEWVEFELFTFEATTRVPSRAIFVHFLIDLIWHCLAPTEHAHHGPKWPRASANREAGLHIL